MEKNNKKTAKIFTLEQQFPCGPQASCCGPIGQTEHEVLSLKNALEQIDLEVEVYDVQKTKVKLQKNPYVFKLLNTFGPIALPIITVENEVACIGNSTVPEVVSAVKAKL